MYSEAYLDTYGCWCCSPDDNDGPSDDEDGCCSWDACGECQETSDYCNSKTNCEGDCGGTWCPGGTDDAADDDRITDCDSSIGYVCLENSAGGQQVAECDCAACAAYMESIGLENTMADGETTHECDYNACWDYADFFHFSKIPGTCGSDAPLEGTTARGALGPSQGGSSQGDYSGTVGFCQPVCAPSPMPTDARFPPDGWDL